MEMSRRGISTEELDNKVASVFKELSGRTELKINEVARLIGVTPEILERILVNQICQKNFHGHIEGNIFFIEET